MSPRVWTSPAPLPSHEQNLAEMLTNNAAKFADKPVFQSVVDGAYRPISWNDFHNSISAIQANLTKLGLAPGDRVAIVSPNRLEMLELELAVMAMGAIAVPIFAGYSAARLNTLVEFCEPKIVAVADQIQYDKLKNPGSFERLIRFDAIASNPDLTLTPIDHLRKHDGSLSQSFGTDVPADTICLMMYTSGTMGKPKCVQLTHGNILSQQAAMRALWNLNENDRFLSFLPWHHSFGGIFEMFAAISNGAVLSLDHGFGKDIDLLLENWKQVKPTVFFSVPRIYQDLITRTLQSEDVHDLIFHDELRFVFTAAAPLPESISTVFKDQNVPVIEGWGLTETSPCCTITDPDIPREPGIVGQPIPGVSLMLDEDGEILVKGPNVMRGYFRNTEATESVLTGDGWFRTGDVGKFADNGLQLVSRKDRIFKLSNAEKVVPAEIENLIAKDCAFLAHAFVTGSGRDYPVALLFPNASMFDNMPEASKLKAGCRKPGSIEGLSTCLQKCLLDLNGSIRRKFSRPQMALLVDHELSIENEELTPSMKLAPNVVGRVFKAQIDALYGDKKLSDQKVYVINLE